MATKKKPPPKLRWRERIAKRAQTNPKGLIVTLSGVGAVVAILGGIWPFLPKFQTVEAAESVIKEIRKEAIAHEKKDERDRLESMYGQQRIETLILRNRVNDCTDRTRTRSIKPVDANVCAEYQQEYREATRRTQYLYEKVQEASK